MREEVNTLKNSFQPIVLSTIQLTQGKLINDKIKALKQIVSFRYKFFSLNQEYIDGTPSIEDIFDYNQFVYRKLDYSVKKELEEIVLKQGYLFPKEIKENLNLIISELFEIYNIQKRENSIQSQDMPEEVIKILDRISEKLNKVIDDIRLDLHIDNTFICISV